MEHNTLLIVKMIDAMKEMKKFQVNLRKEAAKFDPYSKDSKPEFHAGNLQTKLSILSQLLPVVK